MIAYFKSEIPFLRLLLFFVLGISCSISFHLKPGVLWMLLWILIFLALLIIASLYKKTKVYLHAHLPGVLMYVLLFLSGVMLGNQHKSLERSDHFSKTPSDELIVHLTEEPKLNGDIARFNVKVEKSVTGDRIIYSTGAMLLAVRFDTSESLNLHYGDLLLIKSKYAEIEPPYNPSEFNYKKFLSFQQLHHQSFIDQRQIKKIGENRGNPIKSFALKFREHQLQKFKSYIHEKDAQAVASTLILGYRTDLSQDILEAYSKTGTMHVLSVSGMHVAILVLLLNFILKFLDKSAQTRIAKTIFIIAMVWFYALITGLAPSVVRASIMLSLVLIAQASAKKVNIFNVIAIAAFILLLIDPFNLTNVGFQLSFIAVAGLIYIQPLIYNLYDPENKMLKYIWSIVSVSIAAQLSTAPISLYYFHQFPIYFIISNLFIMLPAVFIMYTGVSLLLLSWIIPIARFLGFILNEVIDFTNAGLSCIEEIPHANITQIWLSIFELFLFYVALFLLLSSKKRKRNLKLAFFILGMLVIQLSFKELKYIQQRQVTFFSLRKNSAVALIKGRTAVLLTDLNPADRTYQFSVKPYLDSCQINYIEYLNPYLAHDEKLINFEGHSLKIVTHQNESFSATKVNWLLLSGDKMYSISKSIRKNVDLLFIDGRNRDFVIKRIQQQMNDKGLKTHVLKREKAVEIKL